MSGLGPVPVGTAMAKLGATDVGSIVFARLLVQATFGNAYAGSQLQRAGFHTGPGTTTPSWGNALPGTWVALCHSEANQPTFGAFKRIA